jgi:hypothetical protein
MLEAEHALEANRSNDDLWVAWQRAATDYWVLLHPELASFRAGDPRRTPSIDEMRERAELVGHAMDGIPETWRLAADSPTRNEQSARVAWWHELMAGLFEPIYDAQSRLRGEDESGVETLIRFLEADVYCHRSGYVKADVIRFLTRIELDDPAIKRVRSVVLAAVDGVDRREFRSYVRLARKVDSPDLRAALRSRMSSGRRFAARHAQWVLEGLSADGS